MSPHRLWPARWFHACILGLILTLPMAGIAQQRSTPAKGTGSGTPATQTSPATRPAGIETTASQDRITMRDGQEMNVTIKEITDDAVKYVRADEPEGPVITTAKSRILMIRYRSGRTEIFEATASSSAEKPAAKPARRVSDEDDNEDDDADETPAKPRRKRTPEEVKQIETLVQNVSSQLLHCCSRRKENARHEIYYDGIEDSEAGMRIPIRVSWVGAFESDRWVRGFVITEKGQRTRFTHQSDSGGLGMGCARNCVIQ